jgi:simple sugar transport system permease protein
VITAGEIDLSFPAVVALSGFVFAWVFKNVNSPLGPWLGLVLALACGALVGYINGLLIAKIGVPSIMATLAAQFFWYGATILLANGLQLDIQAVTKNIVHTIFVGRIFSVIPMQAFWSLGLTIFLWFILNRHKFGEEIMFIGDNANVAQVMGIDVVATKIKLFTLMGVIAAFAGLLLRAEVFYCRQWLPSSLEGPPSPGVWDPCLEHYLALILLARWKRGLSRQPSVVTGSNW